jgi:hypothetical protein
MLRKKVEFKFDGNPVPIDLVDPNDTEPDPNKKKTIPMDKTNYHEDYRNYGGKLCRYGHRGESQTAIESYQNADGTANRASGKKYQGIDEPGWKNVPKGHTYKISLSFKGELVSTCNDCNGCSSKEWTVNLENTF